MLTPLPSIQEEFMPDVVKHISASLSFGCMNAARLKPQACGLRVRCRTDAHLASFSAIKWAKSPPGPLWSFPWPGKSFFKIARISKRSRNITESNNPGLDSGLGLSIPKFSDNIDGWHYGSLRVLPWDDFKPYLSRFEPVVWILETWKDTPITFRSGILG